MDLAKAQRIYPRMKFRPSVVVALACCAAVMFPLDVICARFFLSDPFPGELRSLIHKAEFFGHAYGILGIIYTLYLVMPQRRRYLFRLVALVVTAGLLCDSIKLIIHRHRPVDFGFVDGQGTFLGLSFWHVSSFEQIFESAYHSFPSAHTATAVAFAMGLGCLLPAARRWFLFLAGMVALSRFDGGAHYVSDTFVGAIVGYVAAYCVLGPTWLGALCTRFEAGQRLLPAKPAGWRSPAFPHLG